MSTNLTLAGIDFLGFELPERMPAGGAQATVVHRTIGGRRMVDAMGPDDAPIAWSGRFVGETAQLRAFRLDMLRRSGRKVELAFGLRYYEVVIKSFVPVIERPILVSYDIECEVVRDLLAGDGGAESEAAEARIEAELVAAEAAVLAERQVLLAVSVASTAARAAMGDKSAQRGLIYLAQASAEVLIGEAVFAATGSAEAMDAAIAAVTAVGGVVQGGSPAEMAAGFLGTTVSVEAGYSARTAAQGMGNARTGLSTLPR